MTLDNLDRYLGDLELFSQMDVRWGNAIEMGLSAETLHEELKLLGPSSKPCNYS